MFTGRFLEQANTLEVAAGRISGKLPAAREGIQE
jgi:hypothetical protein